MLTTENDGRKRSKIAKFCKGLKYRRKGKHSLDETNKSLLSWNTIGVDEPKMEGRRKEALPLESLNRIQLNPATTPRRCSAVFRVHHIHYLHDPQTSPRSSLTWGRQALCMLPLKCLLCLLLLFHYTATALSISLEDIALASQLSPHSQLMSILSSPLAAWVIFLPCRFVHPTVDFTSSNGPTRY